MSILSAQCPEAAGYPLSGLALAGSGCEAPELRKRFDLLAH